jgi:hypothetical protein
MLKLADFGTAKEDAGKNFTVIGTPFWSILVVYYTIFILFWTDVILLNPLVAPEIIEVSGATTVSGILYRHIILDKYFS